MTTAFPCRLVACCLLLLVPASLPAADEVALRWEFPKDHVFKYLLKHREVRTVQLAEQTFETATTSEYEWQWTVKEIDDKGVATLEMKLTALRVSSTSNSFEFNYDSSRANTSDEDYKKKLINLYDQLRYATYRVRLKPDGRVAEVHGFDKVLAEVTPGTQLADYHGLNLHDDSFAWFVQQALGILPDKAVKPGGKWGSPLKAKLTDLGELSGELSCSLSDKPVQASDRTCQEFRLEGSQALEVDMKFLNNPLRGTLKTSKLTGTVRFDVKAGAVHSSSFQTEVSGDLKLGPGEKPAVLKVHFRHELELEAKP
jgi:hypothetical protein